MTAATRRDRVGAAYVWVPAGAGLAGCWMLRTPVTNAMWRAAVEAGAVKPPRRTDAYDDAAYANHPVAGAGVCYVGGWQSADGHAVDAGGAGR